MERRLAWAWRHAPVLRCPETAWPSSRALAGATRRTPRGAGAGAGARVEGGAPARFAASGPSVNLEGVRRTQVVLVSGGVESSVLLRQVARAHARAHAHARVVPLHIEYAQRAAREERVAAARQVAALRDAGAQAAAAAASSSVNPLISIDLTSLGSSMRALAPHRRAHVPVPHRNLALLAVSVSVCAQLMDGASKAEQKIDGRGEREDDKSNGTDLYIALSKDDAKWYPSATTAFVDAFRSVAATLDGRIAIHTPFANMNKTDIVRVGSALGVPWDDTYSCMVGGKEDASAAGDQDAGLEHCGRCAQCRARKEAFADAGVPHGAHGAYRR